MPTIVEIDVTHKKDGHLEVELKYSDFIAMDEESLEFLLALGIVPIFTVVQETVFCRSGGRNIGVGRLLLDCGVNQAVRYLDFNIKNLRRSNLVKLGGSAKFAARSQISKEFDKRVYQLRHVYE
jgi:hypothetical protein